MQALLRDCGGDRPAAFLHTPESSERLLLLIDAQRSSACILNIDSRVA